MQDDSWIVYIIEAENGKYYTGITTDLQRRLAEHKSGKQGAKFFRSSSPMRVVYQENHPNRSEASKRESEIKKCSREEKRQLVAKN